VQGERRKSSGISSGCQSSNVMGSSKALEKKMSERLFFGSGSASLKAGQAKQQMTEAKMRSSLRASSNGMPKSKERTTGKKERLNSNTSQKQ